MNKKFFYLGYFLSPFIAIIFYYFSTGAVLDSYSVSIMLGVYACVLVGNQLYLASQPAWVIALLGATSTRSLHSTSPLLLLLFIIIHAIMKLSNGFSITTIQVILGLIAFILMLVGTIFALLLFTNTLLTKQEKFSQFRTRMYAKTHLTYQKVRAIHNLMVVAGVLVLIHAILASSSILSYNPWGVSILAIWMLFTLLTYLNYRLHGRKKRGKL